MRCWEIVWALALAAVVAVCAVLLFFPLQRGIRDVPSKTPEILDSVAEETFLRILTTDLSKAEAAEEVRRVTEEQAQDVSAGAKDSIAIVTAKAVERAALDTHNSAIELLQPELEAIGIPSASETTQEIVETALENLTLEPSEVEDRAVLESEITAVAGLAIAEVSEEITASDREALEEVTVNVLSASIADGVEIAKDSAVKNLPDDIKDEVNEQPTGRLSGSVDIVFFSVGDIGIFSTVASVGVLVLEQLLRFITMIVLRKPSSSANTAGAGNGQAGGARL